MWMSRNENDVIGYFEWVINMMISVYKNLAYFCTLFAHTHSYVFPPFQYKSQFRCKKTDFAPFISINGKSCGFFSIFCSPFFRKNIMEAVKLYLFHHIRLWPFFLFDVICLHFVFAYFSNLNSIQFDTSSYLNSTPFHFWNLQEKNIKRV
jgi:hypothetical protein